jgi:hypothetical protein
VCLSRKHFSSQTAFDESSGQTLQFGATKSVESWGNVEIENLDHTFIKRRWRENISESESNQNTWTITEPINFP